MHVYVMQLYVSNAMIFFIIQLFLLPRHPTHLQVSFKPVILQDISMRASTFSADNLERRVLKSGDFFQLHIEVSGGRVEWWKDGQLLEKLNDRDDHYVSVDQPWQTQLLKPGTYKRNEEYYPPNGGHSYFGGRCQVFKILEPIST